MVTVTNRVRCAILAAVALSGVIACATTPKTTSQMQADKETVNEVQSALNSDRVLYARHIVVQADDGVVQLSGYVWNPDDISEAERVAANVTNVKKVVNDLELERNGIDNSPVTR
jgi:osmotically-inducible protein OsmY